jgi:long-subunit fatty acid transport protein
MKRAPKALFSFPSSFFSLGRTVYWIVLLHIHLPLNLMVTLADAHSSLIRLSLLSAVASGLLQAQAPIGVLISEQSRTAFSVQGAGARAQGMGGAFIAVADDATAVSFNPAGLAQLRKPEVSFVGRGFSRRVSFEDFETTTRGRQLAVSDSLSSNRRFDPLFISAALPLRLSGRNLVFQISAQRAFALGENSSRDLQESSQDSPPLPTRRLRQSINQSGEIDLYSLATSYEVSERILLGITYNQWRGNWNLSSTGSKTTGTVTTFVNFVQQNKLDGDNFNLGLIWRWPTWSLGLVHRTPFHADYTFSSTLETNLNSTSLRGDPSTNVGVHWPSSSGIGFAWRPRERWLITADFSETYWSAAKYMTPIGRLNGQNFFDLDKSGRTPNATRFNLGMERLFLRASGAIIPLRCGFSREPQPVVDRITGEQRVIFGLSAGTGFKRGNTTLDLAYRYGWGKRRASQFLEVDQILSRTPPTSLGTERIIEQRLDISFIYQFDRQPVERILRKLFVGN